MYNNLQILLPEIFLSLSIFTLLMIGVYVKKSFEVVQKLTLVVLIVGVLLILNSDNFTIKVFLDSFIRDSFANFFKLFILISSIFVLI